jgi:hypothetical protein
MLMKKSGRVAKLHYMANNFRVLVAGDHVVCATTGATITLDALRYWNVERQEAYATADIAVQAELPK